MTSATTSPRSEVEGRLPVMGKALPLRAAGRIAYADALQLVAKSRRSAMMLRALWGPAVLMGWLRGDLARAEQLLRHWGGVSPHQRLDGVLLYRPRDARGRVYLIGVGREGAVFAKIGRDIGAETLAAPNVAALKAAGFAPHLPFARHRADGFCANLYRYIPQREMVKSRLSLEQTHRFGAALNPAQGEEMTLGRYLARLSPPRPVLAGLPEWLAEHPLRLGRIHGDLMSPNLLQAPSGAGPIVVLDWESLEEAAPLLIDRIGGLDWAQVQQMAGRARNAPRPDPNTAEALAFMVIAAARGFGPARDWLAGAH